MYLKATQAGSKRCYTEAHRLNRADVKALEVANHGDGRVKIGDSSLSTTSTSVHKRKLDEFFNADMVQN